MGISRVRAMRQHMPRRIEEINDREVSPCFEHSRDTRERGELQAAR